MSNFAHDQKSLNRQQISFGQSLPKATPEKVDAFLEDSDAICESQHSMTRVEEAYNAIEEFERRR